MRVKYNRVSTVQQTGNRFSADTDNYDLVLLDKISGSIYFKDRPKAKELCRLVEQGQVKELVVEELSRLGRNTGDVINVLQWLDEHQVNVRVRNIGLESRPGGVKNPIWKMISSVMSSLYEMELENIRERTAVGRHVFVQQGGTLGRPEGTVESNKKFLAKASSQKIMKYLEKNMSVREVAQISGASTGTVQKVKKLMGLPSK